MSLTSLNAISPIDGRYRNKIESLADFFSEQALIKYRVRVEIEYFISLCNSKLPELSDFPTDRFGDLRGIYESFTPKEAAQIKEIESVTNHDVKAVEYFIKRRFEELGLDKFKEFIHFGLTSQDINNTAIPLSMKEAHEAVYLVKIQKLVATLKGLAEEWKIVPMLARTHGQPASPTRLGNEIAVFVERIEQQLALLDQVPFAAKFGVATGNFNAHHVAYPEVDWAAFGKDFVEEVLGLKYSFPTTQIEHYDHMAAFFDGLKRINTVVIDLNRDVWQYISMNYFKQRIKKGEIGSSAMPHKVNPIDFENSEGNLGLANALFEHLSAKLPISRLQRDLTDSTVLRNVGVPIGHSLVGIESTLKGLGKLLLNQEALNADLEDNWAVAAEAIQTILPRESYPDPYEALKGLTRTNSRIDRNSILEVIENLDVDESVKRELKAISPQNYTGI